MNTPLSARLVRYCTTVFALLIFTLSPVQASNNEETKFYRIPTQYIAALGDPQSTSGSGAQHWGLWRIDPGPRGVWIRNYDQLEATGGLTPAKWQFDPSEWWVDENGLLMEKPEFPISPGKYIVTGDRETISILTIHPEDESGDRRWQLDFGAKLYNVTHLPCRSARYTSVDSSNACSPAFAQHTSFPVKPGGIMPAVQGCAKQDYSVLFVIGLAVDN